MHSSSSDSFSDLMYRAELIAKKVNSNHNKIDKLMVRYDLTYPESLPRYNQLIDQDNFDISLKCKAYQINSKIQKDINDVKREYILTKHLSNSELKAIEHISNQALLESRFGIQKSTLEDNKSNIDRAKLYLEALNKISLPFTEPDKVGCFYKKRDTYVGESEIIKKIAAENQRKIDEDLSKKDKGNDSDLSLLNKIDKNELEYCKVIDDLKDFIKKGKQNGYIGEDLESDVRKPKIVRDFSMCIDEIRESALEPYKSQYEKSGAYYKKLIDEKLEYDLRRKNSLEKKEESWKKKEVDQVYTSNIENISPAHVFSKEPDGRFTRHHKQTSSNMEFT